MQGRKYDTPYVEWTRIETDVFTSSESGKDEDPWKDDEYGVLPQFIG